MGEAETQDKPEITFDEWNRLDLRVGEVLSVDEHPNADKLYVMRVKVGEEERQIVAGLRPYRPPEEIQGRQVIVLMNLKPAKLRGVSSKGMLLAAGGFEGVPLGLLTTDNDDVPSGATVS